MGESENCGIVFERRDEAIANLRASFTIVISCIVWGFGFSPNSSLNQIQRFFPCGDRRKGNWAKTISNQFDDSQDSLKYGTRPNEMELVKRGSSWVCLPPLIRRVFRIPGIGIERPKGKKLALRISRI